jgi:hypothetical protein
MSHKIEQYHDEGEQDQKDGNHIPQIFVIGAFLTIFFAQVGVNFLHAVRNGRRRRRFLEMQFPHPLPPRDRNGEPEIDTNTREENAGDGAEGRPVPGQSPGVG